MSDEVDTFLVIWIKSLSNHYNLLNKDGEISFNILEYIYEEEFIYNFFLTHFPKHNLNNFTFLKFETISQNMTKFLDLFKFTTNSSKKLIQVIFANNQTKDMKIIKWKLFFTLTFLEEFSFNKYIKLDENILNTTSNSIIGFFSIINKNIPKAYSMRYLIKSPFILKSIICNVNEILSVIEINSFDYQNILLSFFNEENLNRNLNETELYCYEEDEASNYYMNQELITSVLSPNNSFTTGNNYKGREYNLNLKNCIINTPKQSNTPTPNANSPRQPSTPKKNETPNLSFLDDGFDKYYRPEQFIICDKWEEKTNKVEELKFSINNLYMCINKKDDEIKNLSNYNQILNCHKNELENTLKSKEKIINIYNKQVDNIKKDKDYLDNKILKQNYIIENLDRKNSKLKDKKNVLKKESFKIKNFNLFSEELNISYQQQIIQLENDLLDTKGIINKNKSLINNLNQKIEEKNKIIFNLKKKSVEDVISLECYKWGFILVILVLFFLLNLFI